MLPLQQTQELQSAITEYLKATYTFRERELYTAFHSFLEDEHEGLFKGPYISVQPSFIKVPEGRPVPLEIAPDLTPYQHQAEAFERLSSRNGDPAATLLTTGTGSGKTEAFLFPILDYCYKHRDQKGIKAILLYPMNALATDQASRIAKAVYHDKRLKGQIRAGLFIGTGSRNVEEMAREMGEDHIIEHIDSILDSPPDILLTNFKMLDSGLLRSKFHNLWHYNFQNPGLLRFLALDELHTYDGAQGTDVANLIRRLKLKLGITKGQLCPVGTSATIGEGKDAKRLLTEYAGKIFGEPFDESAVIEESRQPWSSFFPEKEQQISFMPEVEDIRRYQLEENDEHQAYIDKQKALWQLSVSDGISLGKALKRLRIFTDLIEIASEGLLTPAQLMDELEIRNPAYRDLPERDGEDDFNPRYAVLESLLALLAVAREDSMQAKPLLYLRVQIWIRELSGIMRLVSESPAFTWRDSRKPEDEKQVSLPMYFCRECGASGWITKKNDNHNKLEKDPADIFKDYFKHQKNVYFVNTDTPGHQPVEDAAMTHVLHEQVSTKDLSFTREKTPDSLALLAARKLNDKGTTDHICPECATPNTVSVVGTRMATLSSIAVSQSLSSNLDVQRDESRKLLAFTNGVQDAAHHAGFIEARNYRFMFRTSLQQAIRALPEKSSLEQLAAGFREYWQQKLGSQSYAYRFYPDDCAKRAPIELYKNKNGRFSADFRKELDYRITWEILAEFGYNSLIGRTLQKTGSSAVYIDTATYEELFSVMQPWMEQNKMESVDKNALESFVAGILYRIRTRGGLDHAYLKKYREEEIKVWSLSWLKDTRHFLNRRFHPQQRFPKLLTTRAHAEGLLDTTFTRQRNWYHAYFKKTFTLVADNTELINEFYTELLDRLTALKVTNIAHAKNGSSYAIRPDVLYVSRKVVHRECNTCGHRIALADEDKALAASACQQYRCSGHYSMKVDTRYNYYNKVYSRSHAPRVSAHEHTGILERPVREHIERRFKSDKAEQGLNTLVATSTLEMGINIGKLNTAYNLGIPPLPANYLQRIGRAGRKTGSAVIANFAASGDSHDLFFMQEPHEMMAGKVHTPGCYINAPEILKRQLTAHFIDMWIKEDPERHVVPGIIMNLNIGVTDLRAPEFFLNQIYSWVQENYHDLFQAIRKVYEPELKPELLEAIGQEIEDGSFSEWLLAPFSSLKQKINAIQQQRKDIVEDLKTRGLGKEDEEYKQLQQEKSSLGKTVTRIRKMQVLEFLTVSGILPNYAFPDKGVELSARIFQPQAPGAENPPEVLTKEYVRPSSTALRELAPHNTFFAEGYKFQISGLLTHEWGGQNSTLERFRFCSHCDHIAPAAGKENKTCPKCGDESFGAASNTHQYALLTSVRSEVLRERAALDDSSDDRSLVIYRVQRHLNFPEHSGGSLALVDIPFGLEFVSGVEIMEVNLGKMDTANADRITINQQEGIPRHGFVTCRHCGFSTNTPAFEQDPSNHNKTPFHYPFCRHRHEKYTGQSSAIFEEVYLYRRQQTEALKILLPTQEFESSDYRHLFKAGIEIGLRDFYKGNPSHLAFLEYQEFNKETGKFDQYLVLYDRVPGGTGYLYELYDKQVFTGILERAYKKIKGCNCQHEGKDGCYHCVYSYRNKYISSVLSRQKAEAEFERLLKHATQWKVLGHALSNVTKDGRIEESELEERFIYVLKKWSNKQSWTFEEHVRNRAMNYFITLPLAKGFGEKNARITYQVKPQVQLGRADGVSVSQRCDFLFIPVQVEGSETLDKHSFSTIVVEMDGYQYHASLNNNRFAQDLEKRKDIISSDTYALWVLTWDDVDAFMKLTEENSKPEDIEDEYSLTLREYANKHSVVFKTPAGKKFQGIAACWNNSLARLLYFMGTPRESHLFAAGIAAMACSPQFPYPLIKSDTFDEHLIYQQDMRSPTKMIGKPEGKDYIWTGWSQDNDLYQARIIARFKDGQLKSGLYVYKQATKAVSKEEWQRFWRLVNLIQYDESLNIRYITDDAAAEDTATDSAASAKEAVLENYDESVHRIVQHCLEKGIDINPEGGFTLMENGKEIAGAELAIESQKLVFEPFGEHEASVFTDHGYRVADPETFDLNQLSSS